MDILFDFEETGREPAKNDLMRHMDYLEKIWLNVDSQKHWAIGPYDIQDLISDSPLVRNPLLETHEDIEENKCVLLQQEHSQKKRTLDQALDYIEGQEVKYKARKRAWEIADEFKTMDYPYTIGPYGIQDLIHDGPEVKDHLPEIEVQEEIKEKERVLLQQEHSKKERAFNEVVEYMEGEQVKYKTRKGVREIADEFAEDTNVDYPYTIGHYGIQDLIHDSPEVKDHLPETEVQEEIKEKECVLLQQERAQKKRAFDQAVEDEEVEEMKYKARTKAWDIADEFAEDIAEDYLYAEEIIRFEKRGGGRKGNVKQRARGKGQTKKSISPIVKSELAKLERCYIKSEEAARRLVQRR